MLEIKYKSKKWEPGSVKLKDCPITDITGDVIDSSTNKETSILSSAAPCLTLAICLFFFLIKWQPR